MEAFQLLSRGGVQFNKNRFRKDVQLFTKAGLDKPTKALKNDISELPAELDFFKYAKGGSGPTLAKRKACAAEGSNVEGSEDEPAEKRRKVMASENPMPKHRVTAKGSNVPESAETFEDLRTRYNISSLIMQNLEKSGYIHPMGIQQHGIPILLESRDLAAISPTGTGKTLSYLLPIICKLGAPAAHSTSESGTGVRAVVLAPTRELAAQIYNECLKLAQGRKWRLILFSKSTANTLSDKNVRDKVDIIISTPLRLVASLQSGSLDLSNVRHLVLDEADRLLDSEFLEQVQEVVAACSHPAVQKAVFSATLPAGAEKLAMSMLDNPVRIVVGLKDTPLPLIAQSLTYVADEASKLPTLVQHLSQPYSPPILVFISTQPRASSLAEQLVLYGVKNVDCLHAGMTKKERDDAVHRMRAGESWVMICTEVMARGMDFKGVQEVVNYDYPTSVQSYIHRVGRTGRAGREGKATTYFTNEDAPFLKSIANVILQSGSSVPEWILKLPKPSKMKRRQMGKVARGEDVTRAGQIGKQDAVKKRDMIAGSKRRRLKEALKGHAEPSEPESGRDDEDEYEDMDGDEDS